MTQRNCETSRTELTGGQDHRDTEVLKDAAKFSRQSLKGRDKKTGRALIKGETHVS